MDDKFSRILHSGIVHIFWLIWLGMLSMRLFVLTWLAIIVDNTTVTRMKENSTTYFVKICPFEVFISSWKKRQRDNNKDRNNSWMTLCFDWFNALLKKFLSTLISLDTLIHSQIVLTIEGYFVLFLWSHICSGLILSIFHFRSVYFNHYFV